MMLHSYSTNLEGPLTSLALSPNYDLIAVAGRNVFKILPLEERGFGQATNLRLGKHINLNFSANDVSWSPLDASLLATAATNGAVVLWNLSLPGRSKLSQLYSDHTRTVNRVTFHPTQPSLLLSCSQDSTMRLFDLRSSPSAPLTFNSQAGSVRDASFSPFNQYMFAAVLENGCVQLWDTRYCSGFERSFTGHSGPVFALDWHKVDARLLATAGRDRQIKVWDVSPGSKLTPLTSIGAIAPVTRVRWRPNYDKELASSSLVVDSSVYVWSVSRPFVPKRAFMNHRDVVSGFVWREGEALISACKDGTLYHHIMTESTAVGESAGRVGLSFNCRNDLCLVRGRTEVEAEAIRPTRSDSNGTGWTVIPGNVGAGLSLAGNVGSLPVSSGVSWGMSQSAPGSGSLTASSLQTTLPPISGDMSKLPISRTVEIQNSMPIFSSIMCVFDQYEIRGQLSMDWFVTSAKHYKLYGKSLGELCDHNAEVAAQLQRPIVAQSWRIVKQLYCAGNLGIDTPEIELNALNLGSSCGGDVNGDSSGQSDDHESDSDSEGYDEVDRGATFTTTFGLQGINEEQSSASAQSTKDGNVTSTRDGVKTEDLNKSIAGNERNLEKIGGKKRRDKDLVIANENFSRAFTTPLWNFNELIVDMLKFFVKQGDVQSSVSFAVVLGESIRNKIPEITLEMWFHAYLELLSRFELWNVANQLIKMSLLPNISAINQTSTTIYTSCSKCQRPFTNKVAWLCDRCNTTPSQCSICHGIVKGLYLWCQGCSHGGHLTHIQDWFINNQRCPTGCGHICEFS